MERFKQPGCWEDWEGEGFCVGAGLADILSSILSAVGAGSVLSALVLARKMLLLAPKRFLWGRGVGRLGWADALSTSSTVSDWVDSLEGCKRGPCLAGTDGTVGGAVIL